jgi:hypothetical protein
MRRRRVCHGAPRIPVYAFVGLVACLALSRLAQGPPLVEPIPGQAELEAAAADLSCIKATCR